MSRWYLVRRYSALVWFGLWLSLWAGSASAVPRFAYTANYFGGSISIYRVDAETGMLYHQSHVPTIKSPSSIILHPSGKFLYAISQIVDQIAIYRVNPQTGELTEISDSPVPSYVRGSWHLEVSPDGKYLYVPGIYSFDLVVFKINPESGALTPLGDKSFPTNGGRVRYITTTPDGRFVYLGNTFSDKVAAFKVDTGKDQVTPVPGMPFPSGSTPQGLITHPNGKYLYVPNWQTSKVTALDIDQTTGALSPIQDSKAETGIYPFNGTTDPTGKFLYVANWGDSTVSGFRIDQQTGALSPMPGMPVPAVGAGPNGVVFDAAGRYAYVTNYEDVSLTIFEPEPGTGRLVNPRHMYTRPGVRRLVLLEGDTPVQIQPGMLVASDDASGSVVSYAVSAESGELTQRDKQPLGEAPGAIALDPMGRFVYAVDEKRKVIESYVIGSDGKLTPVSDGTLMLEGLPRDIRVDHRGSYLYVVTEKPNHYLVFAIDAKTGKPSPSERVLLPEDSLPQRVLASPEERLSFILDSAGGRVFSYRYYDTSAYPLMYDLGDNYGSPMAVPEQPLDMAVDPTGLNGLLLDKAGRLSVYRLPTVWRPLKLMGPGPIPAGKQPVAVAVHPRGGFAYVVDAGTSTVHQFRLDADSGELAVNGEPVTVSAVPAGIDIDPSGHFAYVRYANKPGLTRYAIDAQSGRLGQPRELLEGVRPRALAISTLIR